MTDLVIDDNTSAGDLRKAYEKIRSELAAATTELGTLQSETRASTVAKLLQAKGVEAATKAANFYPADGGTDEASVTAWVEANKDFIRITDPTTPAATTTTASTTAPPAAGTATDPNVLAAQLVALATAAGGNEAFGMSNPQGAPTLDIDRMAQIQELMRNAPRTPEGYQQLVAAGIFPASAPGM